MTRVATKETPTNLVYRYDVPQLRSLDDLDAWFNALASIRGLSILRVECIDRTERFSEGADTFEYDRQTATQSLADAIRKKRVDSVSILVDFRGMHIAVRIGLRAWKVSIAGDKKRKEILDALEAELNKIG